MAVAAGVQAGEHSSGDLVCGCGHAQFQPPGDVVQERRKFLLDDLTGGVALVGIAATGLVARTLIERLQRQRQQRVRDVLADRLPGGVVKDSGGESVGLGDQVRVCLEQSVQHLLGLVWAQCLQGRGSSLSGHR